MFSCIVVKQHFCRVCSTISYHCLDLCLLSSFLLGAGQARRRAEYASAVFGHAFSHTAFQTDLLTSTHFILFLLSQYLFPFLLSLKGSIPQNHWLSQTHKETCFSHISREMGNDD